MPIYAAVFMVFTLGNVGLPGTTGFIGEFLSLVGVYQVNTWVAIFATTGIILSAAYALWLYGRVVFGALEKPSLQKIPDMGFREFTVMAPLVAATVFFGIYPAPIFQMTGTAVEQTLVGIKAKLASTASTPTIPETAANR
jgi:NADH-quinone oxidoreductase subunit M